MKILVVEDTFIAQKVIQSMLIRQGCEVDIAGEGLEALEMSIKIQYDLILMDIGLGDGPDGFETTAIIKSQSELNKTTPIMAVTAHGEDEYKQKALDYGMEGYFNKPFTTEDAKAIIDYRNAMGAKKAFKP